MTYTVGEPVRWRLVNGTNESHPLHLHGTYFTVERVGDNQADSEVPAADRMQAVTETVDAGHTRLITWSPQRPGRWLFHCHILFHVMPELRDAQAPFVNEFDDLPHDKHMTGLVLAITALPAGVAPKVTTAKPRRMTMWVGERQGIQYDRPTMELNVPGLGYAIVDGDGKNGQSIVASPGPVLVLERGRPVEITIHNALHHSTSVHWHGIELESYYDGVPHVGGEGPQVTPSIPPGGSFVARFTPPRAGTFMYHTHYNDFVQLTSGLYGEIVVREPGATKAVDLPFIFGRDGPLDREDALLMNGKEHLDPIKLKGGQLYRIRLACITPAPDVRVRLLAGDQVLQWRAVAKDGADLPASRAIGRPAEVQLAPGETYDFEFTAPRAGTLMLDAEIPGFNKRASAPLVVY
jgi:manganese oxidase